MIIGHEIKVVRLKVLTSIRISVSECLKFIISREGLILTLSILPCLEGWIS